MAETAAHLVDHVFPPLPVRQWVLATRSGCATSYAGGQWPLYFGEPTFPIKASQHRIGIVLIGAPKF
jgi:hypothetical protein